MPINATDVLITASEVLEATPRAQGGSPEMITPILPLKEEGLFRVWLGMEFYEDLLANLADYSSFSYFQEGTTYALDSVVLYRDKLYKAKASTNGSKPTDSTYWGAAPKFESETYTFFWDRYLKTVISWHVFHSGVIYQALRTSELGVSRVGGREDSETRPASARELTAFKSEISSDLNDFLQTMDRYLRANKVSFPNYLPNKYGDKSTDGTTKRGVGRPRPNYGFSF